MRRRARGMGARSSQQRLMVLGPTIAYQVVRLPLLAEQGFFSAMLDKRTNHMTRGERLLEQKARRSCSATLTPQGLLSTCRVVGVSARSCVNITATSCEK